MSKIQVQNQHIHLTDEPRGDSLTNRCLTADVSTNTVYIKGWRGETEVNLRYSGSHTIEMFTDSVSKSFEIDIILDAAPTSNIFIYDIQTTGLNFYYQPELTQAEIDSGSSRPENVVGSYAVYHSTNRNNHNYQNNIQKNYMTGKFCHIYRPQATDASGSSVWCDLDIDTDAGTMKVTVPQTFLDSAIYPVRIDPEFGTSTIGGSVYYMGASDQYKLRMSPLTAKYISNGTLESISAYTWTFNNPGWPSTKDLFQLGVYTSGSGAYSGGSSLVTSIGPFEYATYNDPKWITKSISVPLSNEIYQVAFSVYMEALGYLQSRIRWSYDSTSEYGTTEVSLSSWSWPNTTPTGTYEYKIFSIYATYSEIPSPGIHGLNAETGNNSTGTILSWYAGPSHSGSTSNCKVTIQYSTDGIPHLVPNTPPYVVRDLVQRQGTSNVLWHSHDLQVDYYSMWIFYEDTHRWLGPYVLTPSAASGSTEPFTSGSISFSKLGTNTKLSTRQDIVVDIIVWLPENQMKRAPALEAALQLVAPAHTKLNVLYEHYYIAQTTTEQFNSATFDPNVYEVKNGTIINKKPTIDSSYSGDANILGEI